MKKTKFIWMNGKIIPWAKAQVHILSHTLHYGSGVFEGIRFYKTTKGTAIFRLQDHIKRLFYSAEKLEFKNKFKAGQIEKACIELIRKNKIKEGYIRPIIFLGADKIGLNPSGCEANIAVVTVPFGSYLGKERIRVKTSPYRRLDPSATDIQAKISGHYVNSILASIDAKNSGYDEAMFLDRHGNVAEGPGENIFMVKNKKIITPSKKYIFAGITRDSIIKIAREEKLKVTEKTVSLRKIKNADEAFMTGTAAEVTAIKEIDNKKFEQETPITDKLKKKFTDVVHGKIPKYNKWLTYV